MAVSCTDKALALLALRPHFRRELESKLAKRGYEEIEIDSAVERMGELGYLDEAAAVRSFVEEKLRRGPLGRRRLEADLGRRRADAGVVAKILEELVDHDDREPALEAARRHTRGRARNKASVARHLERKGFSSRAIFSALDALNSEDMFSSEDSFSAADD